MSQIPADPAAAARPMALRLQSATTAALRQAQSRGLRPEPVEGASTSSAHDQPIALGRLRAHRVGRRGLPHPCSPRRASAAARRAAAAAPLPRPGVRSARSRPIATAAGCTSQPPSARLRHSGSTAAASRRAAPAGHAGSAPRRHRGARVQPRAAGGRRIRVDGCEAPDGGSQSRRAFPPAGRIPAQGQGRLDHFPGAEATLALPPTSSIDTAARRLQDLPTGGRTPLAEGLLCAAETLRLERIRDPRRRPLLVLVTDGRATYGPNAVARSRLVADAAPRRVASLVIDCESGRMSLGLAQTLSIHLGAQYLTVGEVGADQLVHAVRQGRAA